MSDDIVKKRLLRANGYDILREEPIYVNPDGPKAVDEIERLRAELAVERERADMALQRAYTLECERDTAEAERDALRAKADVLQEQFYALLKNHKAELAAARKQAAQIFTDGGERISAAEAERDALRELLREARPMVSFCYRMFANKTLPARINAAVKDTDEKD